MARCLTNLWRPRGCASGGRRVRPGARPRGASGACGLSSRPRLALRRSASAGDSPSWNRCATVHPGRAPVLAPERKRPSCRPDASHVVVMIKVHNLDLSRSCNVCPRASLRCVHTHGMSLLSHSVHWSSALTSWSSCRFLAQTTPAILRPACMRHWHQTPSPTRAQAGEAPSRMPAEWEAACHMAPYRCVPETVHSQRAAARLLRDLRAKLPHVACMHKCHGQRAENVVATRAGDQSVFHIGG